MVFEAERTGLKAKFTCSRVYALSMPKGAQKGEVDLVHRMQQSLWTMSSIHWPIWAISSFYWLETQLWGNVYAFTTGIFLSYQPWSDSPSFWQKEQDICCWNHGKIPKNLDGGKVGQTVHIWKDPYNKCFSKLCTLLWIIFKHIIMQVRAFCHLQIEIEHLEVVIWKIESC